MPTVTEFFAKSEEEDVIPPSNGSILGFITCRGIYDPCGFQL